MTAIDHHSPEELAAAYAHCARLAYGHYENFPVARLVPRHLRPAVAAVYAFARTADDFADEGYDLPVPPPAEQRLQQLDQWAQNLQSSLEGRYPTDETRWIFLAVADAIRRHQLPAALFHDLLSAFRQDVLVKRYQDFTQLLDYSRRSANPVGRLVLLLHDHREEQLFAWSDLLCTALQLTNFWQDLAIDWKKDRLYLPLQDLHDAGASTADLGRGTASPALRAAVLLNVERTARLFRSCRHLPSALPRPLSWEIRLTWLGGYAILQKVRRQHGDTLQHRPTLGKWEMGRLLLLALLSRKLPGK